MFISVNPVGSKFAKALQQGLKAVNIESKRVDHDRGMHHWLNGKSVFFVTQQTLNKIDQFKAFTAAGVTCPPYAFTAEDARNLDSRTIFARTLVNSTGGRGIVEFERTADEYPRASLYTGYIPKKAEFRVHVLCGRVIDVQQKKKKVGFEEDRNTRIRNLSNGYVYTRGDIVEPVGLRELATKAVDAVGYSYGAVDIIYNERNNSCYVLEVNSRPGLMGTTLDRYVNAIKELV